MQEQQPDIQYSTPNRKSQYPIPLSQISKELAMNQEQGNNHYLINTFQSTTKYSLNHLNSIFFKNGRIYNMLERTAEKKIIKCGCVKSFCQAKYCECYRNGQICGKDCSCKGCKNTLQTYNKKLTENSIKSMPIQSNQPIQLKFENPNGNLLPINVHTGCKCKKSGCSKKYCQCFQNGRKCGSSCTCFNCLNGREHINDGKINQNYADQAKKTEQGRRTVDNRIERQKKQSDQCPEDPIDKFSYQMDDDAMLDQLLQDCEGVKGQQKQIIKQQNINKYSGILKKQKSEQQLQQSAQKQEEPENIKNINKTKKTKKIIKKQKNFKIYNQINSIEQLEKSAKNIQVNKIKYQRNKDSPQELLCDHVNDDTVKPEKTKKKNKMALIK